jgi:hypothetical protein
VGYDSVFVGNFVGVAHWFSTADLRAGESVVHTVEAGFLRPYLLPDSVPRDVASIRAGSDDASVAFYEDGGPVTVSIDTQDPMSDFALSGRTSFRIYPGERGSGSTRLTATAHIHGERLERSYELRVT